MDTCRIPALTSGDFCEAYPENFLDDDDDDGDDDDDDDDEDDEDDIGSVNSDLILALDIPLPRYIDHHAKTGTLSCKDNYKTLYGDNKVRCEGEDGWDIDEDVVCSGKIFD